MKTEKEIMDKIKRIAEEISNNIDIKKEVNQLCEKLLQKFTLTQ